jgi:Zn-dependent protease
VAGARAVPDPEARVSGARDEAAERRLRNLQAVARHVSAHGDPAAPPRTPEPERSRAGRWARWGTIGAVLAFVAGKLKLIVPLIKFAKLGTLLSMVVAVWAYALLWGVPFALGFVLLIFVHELGHALVMRQQGIPAGAPVFIPFLGAVIAMRGQPRNAYVEALVGIGGPVLGSAGAFVCLAVAWATGEPFWYALASSGFLINLFNLLPISPLDGGRIVGVISRWFWAVGYAIGIAMFAVTRHPLLFLILLFGLMGLGQAIRGPRPGYYDVAPARRVAMGAAYFGLAALLALAMRAAEAPLEGIGGM